MAERIIKNFNEIATTSLRKDALEILEAGYRAINTQNVIRYNVRLESNNLFIKDKKFPLADFKRIFVIGIGKCAYDTGVALEGILKDKITDGIVVDIKEGHLNRIKSYAGTHPFPSQTNVDAAQNILELLKSTKENDLVIFVISGGGSALLCAPYEIDCDVMVEITRQLQMQGATIEETNIVRKHLDRLKGGGLAKEAYPASAVSLIFSDVPGDDLSIIASGPTVYDKSAKEDASRILTKYNILKKAGLNDLKLLETPKEKKYFEKVENILVLTNKIALEAMQKEAKKKGYNVSIQSTNLQGEARKVGLQFAEIDQKTGTCFLAGGETTVTVKGSGKGGRNQELVLGALSYIKKGVVIISAASDGYDNIDVAGAIGDKDLLAGAEKKDIDPQQYLKNNDSYNFFKKVGGHIITDLTGANVADFIIVIKEK